MSKCCVCGKEDTFSNVPHVDRTCDECNRHICDECYGTLPITYVKRVTRQGMVGNLVLCNQCRELHTDKQSISTVNTPYIN